MKTLSLTNTVGLKDLNDKTSHHVLNSRERISQISQILLNYDKIEMAYR